MITCPVCKMTSWNENDWREGYCGNCHAYTSAPAVHVSRDEETDGRFPVVEMADGSRWREMSHAEQSAWLRWQASYRGLIW